jgi:hypothetical protein
MQRTRPGFARSLAAELSVLRATAPSSWGEGGWLHFLVHLILPADCREPIGQATVESAKARCDFTVRPRTGNAC